MFKNVLCQDEIEFLLKLTKNFFYSSVIINNVHIHMYKVLKKVCLIILCDLTLSIDVKESGY